MYGRNLTHVLNQLRPDTRTSTRTTQANQRRLLLFGPHATPPHCCCRGAQHQYRNDRDERYVHHTWCPRRPCTRASSRVSGRDATESRNDVCAFWRLAITAHRRSPSTPFPPPSAASKFLALLVALVALSTANAADAEGSAGAVSSTPPMARDTASDAQRLSPRPSPATTGLTSPTGDYTSDIASHVTALSGTTYTALRARTGSDAASRTTSTVPW